MQIAGFDIHTAGVVLNPSIPHTTNLLAFPPAFFLVRKSKVSGLKLKVQTILDSTSRTPEDATCYFLGLLIYFSFRVRDDPESRTSESDHPSLRIIDNSVHRVFLWTSIKYLPGPQKSLAPIHHRNNPMICSLHRNKRSSSVSHLQPLP